MWSHNMSLNRLKDAKKYFLSECELIESGFSMIKSICKGIKSREECAILIWD